MYAITTVDVMAEIFPALGNLTNTYMGIGQNYFIFYYRNIFGDLYVSILMPSAVIHVMYSFVISDVNRN